MSRNPLMPSIFHAEALNPEAPGAESCNLPIASSISSLGGRVIETLRRGPQWKV